MASPQDEPGGIGARALGALRRHAVKILASLIIAGGFLWVFQKGGLPLWPSGGAFSKMAWWVLPAAIGSNVAASFFRTYRWVYLLRPIAPKVDPLRVLGIGLVGFTAVLFAPFRMGEVARPYLISQDGEVTFAQATGTVGAERVIDGLFVTVSLLGAMLASTPISPLPTKIGNTPLPVDRVPAAVYGMLGVFIAAFVAMGLFYWARDFARKLTLAILGVVSKKLAAFVADKVEGLAHGLAFLPTWSVTSRFLRDTTIYWGLIGVGQWAALRGFGVEATLAQAWVTVGVIGLGSLIPAGPGFFGAYQLAAYCGLAMYFDEATVLGSGAGFVFVIYTCQLGVSVVSCLVGLVLLRLHPRKPQPVDPVPATP